MSDIYTQMNLLSSSIGVALHNHMSTNNVNHDALEGFVHANSVHISFVVVSRGSGGFIRLTLIMINIDARSI